MWQLALKFCPKYIVFKWQHKVLSDSGYVEHMNHLVNILSSLFKTRISDVLPVNQYISEKTHIHTVTLTLLKTGFFFFLSTCFKPFITSPWLPSFGGLYTENSSWNPLLQTMMTKVKLTNSISKSRFFLGGAAPTFGWCCLKSLWMEKLNEHDSAIFLTW